MFKAQEGVDWVPFLNKFVWEEGFGNFNNVLKWKFIIEGLQINFFHF